jgi:hypothetical protein
MAANCVLDLFGDAEGNLYAVPSPAPAIPRNPLENLIEEDNYSILETVNRRRHLINRQRKAIDISTAVNRLFSLCAELGTLGAEVHVGKTGWIAQTIGEA